MHLLYPDVGIRRFNGYRLTSRDFKPTKSDSGLEINTDLHITFPDGKVGALSNCWPESFRPTQIELFQRKYERTSDNWYSLRGI